VELIGLSTLAEDSGLWVMALGGAPGVRSARFAGSASARGIKPPSARGIKSDEPIPQAEEPETKDRIIPQAKDYTANNRELLSRLSGQKDRRARFRTVAVLALPDGRAWKTEGILAGHISEAPRGRGGFGYDPVFIPEGETRTLAELCPEEKDAISHRRLALEQLRPILATLTTDRDLRPSPKD
jgi:XTP/dITP diphosphohydrolase